MRKDVGYGRIKPARGTHVLDGRSYRAFTIAFWIHDSNPPYATMETYLEYETQRGIWRIYNPLQVNFSYRMLLSTIKTIEQTGGSVIERMNIVGKYK